MCGIYFSICKTEFLWPDATLRQLLCARGPDCQTLLPLSGPQVVDRSHGYYLAAFASVLSLRGERVVSQPLQDEAAGLVFCWNGEAWKMGGNPVSGNDAQVIFHLLVTALTASPTDSRQVIITEILSSVVGPYSFVLYDQTINRIFFGRDRLGRRSLLCYHRTDSFVLCSVTDPDKHQTWSEIETSGLSTIDLKEITLRDDHEINPTLIPWTSLATHTYTSQRRTFSLTDAQVRRA